MVNQVFKSIKKQVTFSPLSVSFDMTPMSPFKMVKFELNSRIGRDETNLKKKWCPNNY